MKITPTHKHDCNKCRFITATHNDHGETFDWYICGQTNPSIIGRFDSEGSHYWSEENRYVWSERMQIAHLVYSWWRTDPNML